ncbi:MAG: UTP--glucose-1-phosphate uridylyltransferase [Deltaproteobacteria bacterium]|nr:UTP--glucose-1-phosphate uridylyltransferase [Deltaproteobacteria bacterium]
MARVRQAVIPVAGLGTRFLPATKVVPKEMLPIVDRPTLQYVVEEAFASGIEHVVLIQGRGKSAIEDHFDTSYELEDTLEKRGKKAEAELVRGIARLGSISSVRQKVALGLGHAVLSARPVIRDEPFAVLLGDDLYRTAPDKRPGIGQLIDAFEATGVGQVALLTVPRNEIHKYGAAEGESEGENEGPQRFRISALVEKPPKGTEKTDKAVVGRYVLPPEIWSILEATKPGKGGEIQLTDALDVLRARQGLMGVIVDGRRVDAGDKLGFLEANLLEALSRPELKAGTLALLRQLLAEAERA